MIDNNAFDYIKFTLFFSLSLHTLAPQTILYYNDIINILDPLIDEALDPLRGSLSNIGNIPDGLPNISTYMKFVDHEKEIKQLMKNMEKLHYLVKNLD